MKKQVTDIRESAGLEEEVVIVIRNGSVVHFSQRRVDKASGAWWKEERLPVQRRAADGNRG